MTKYLLALTLILTACGGQIGGSDPQEEDPSQVGDPAPTTEDPNCALLDAYWQALDDSGCTASGPGSSATEVELQGHSCVDSVALLDGCYKDPLCRGPHSLMLLQACKTGLVPWWPRLRPGLLPD